jgi:Reverse transcriptase (RNA-dependent DNA polymerase)
MASNYQMKSSVNAKNVTPQDLLIIQQGRDIWPQGINIESSSIQDVNNFITYKMVEYRVYETSDNDLWSAFREDFKDFTITVFDMANTSIIRQLRPQLRLYGVRVDTDRKKKVSETLYEVLKEEEPPDWIDEEVIQHVRTIGPFKSPNINYLIREVYPHGLGVTSEPPPSESSLDIKGKGKEPIKEDSREDSGHQKEKTLPGQLGPERTQYTSGHQHQEQESRYYEHQRDERGTGSDTFGREITTLMKMYSTDIKYGGEGDNFDFKLTIFHDMCGRADVPEEAKAKAYPVMLRGLALDHYYSTVINAIKTYGLSFRQMCDTTRTHFESPEYKRGVLAKWNAYSLKEVMRTNKGKSTIDSLQVLIKELRHMQHGLDIELRGDKFFHNKLITACQNVPACQIACSNPPDTIAELINKLHSAITTWEAIHPPESTQFNTSATIETREAESDQFFTDRRYHSKQPNQRPRFKPAASQSGKKACFICKKEGCWSSNHTKEEQEESKRRFKAQLTQHSRFDKYTKQYITEFEGVAPNEEDNDSIEEVIDTMMATGLEDVDSDEAEHFITSFGAFQSTQATDILIKLANQSTIHALTGQSPKGDDTKHAALGVTDPFTYISTTPTRYNSTKFYGVMIDTGASKKSTAGYGQYLACKDSSRHICTEINKATAGAVNVQFGIGSATSIGSVIVDMPIGQVEFHIVEADTPFLLCLKDMDRLGVYFNNLTNQLILPSKTIPVARRFGHPFMMWNEALESYIAESLYQNPCFLTTTELRRLHRRFGHPSADRLHTVLERSGHDDIDKKTLERLTKLCEHCQKHGKSPGRFKFTLRDENIDFNHSIYVDIMYIDNQPILHVIDEATRFQAARFLKDVSTKHTWDMLRLCWIDTYIGPPELITHDAGRNFISKEFRQNARTMAISTKAVPVEAHWSIGLVERAHAILRRAYQIIQEECSAPKDVALQMAVKAVNDTAGPGGLIPTLLVFGAYPRMVESDPPAPSITVRATAIRKAMQEVMKLRLQRQVKEALMQRNGPDTSALHDTPINSDVLVWREGKPGRSGKWTGPFKLLGINGETCRIQQTRGPVEFRTTVVKPFMRDDIDTSDTSDTREAGSPESQEEPSEVPAIAGSSANSGADIESTDEEADIEAARLLNMWQDRTNSGFPDLTVFLANIAEPGHQFASSRQKELTGLLNNRVFEVVRLVDIPFGTRIFNSRFVDEVKNEGTADAFEKSRLVVQAYRDGEKDTVLTQSPTIQRASQRLILAFAVILPDVKLYLRDITQAYTQSKTCLNRAFYIRPPIELQLEEGSILRVVKPLYGVPEAGNHWYNTYHTHHIDQLDMSQSTYDPCLLYTRDTRGFGLVGLQTDDTIILADTTFAATEETKLQKSKLLSKPREQLTQLHALKFNGGLITLEADGSILLNQERQCENIQLVDMESKDLKGARGAVRKNVDLKDQYVAQRARGAYVATVSQPEAAFDLSFAAQAVGPPTKDQVDQLNKRLQWQMDNPCRGLRFIKLDIDSLRLIAFTDASFANNKDLSSQIGFVIVIADKDGRANILHWTSIKCKRVTRSVLASELYGMAHGFDIASAIKATIECVLKNKLPLIMCTDSKSLYDCLVKLGTTQEKRLMVDILCLRQAYERREITEVKWIEGSNNPADALTKGTKACPALRDLVDSNSINLEAIKWVERAGD